MRRLAFIIFSLIFTASVVYGSGKVIGVEDPAKVAGTASAKVLGVIITPVSATYDTGLHNPGTTSEIDSGSYIDWANTDNVRTSNDAWATAALDRDEQTETILATNFGFGVPGGATILGILVQVEARTSGLASGAIREYNLQMYRDGAAVGDNLATGGNWSGSYDTVYDSGGSTNMWGTTWTVAQINNPGTGVIFSAKEQNTADETAQIDHIKATVYYSGGVVCSYVQCNGFETEGDDASWATVSGTPDYDNTDFSPEGLESMKLVGTNPGPAASASITIAERAETWISFQIRANDNNEGDEDVVLLYNDSTLLGTLTCNSETDWSVTAEGGTESGEDDVNINTATWYMKLRFKQGTGANAELEFWASSDGTNWAHNLSSTDGTSTAQVNKVVFQNSHDTEILWIDNFIENSADITDAR